MRQTYNKLVRDRIPEIIEANGQTFAAEVLSTETFKDAVRAKIVEEAHEVAAADTEEALIKEIADLYEIVDAIIDVYQLDKRTIHKIQAQRKAERGGFARRINLLWAE